MAGWILFKGDKKESNGKVLANNFEAETLKNKLHILEVLLCDNFEIYYREESGNVYVYDKMCEEFITENGFEANNIYVFVSNLIEDLD